MLSTALARSRTVLLAPWDPGAALDLIEREEVTVQPSMPVYLRGMLAHPGFSRERVRSLRLYPMGGARVTALDVRDATARLGCPSRRTYGLTEMPTLTTGPVGDPRHRHETTEGLPIGHNEVRIVDERRRGGARPGARARSPAGGRSCSPATSTPPPTRAPSPPTAGSAPATSGRSTTTASSPSSGA